jgi:two-component system, LytTR family, sensor kinase
LQGGSFQIRTLVIRFDQNTKLLTPGIFTRRPLLSFFIHWIAWILLYLITYLPTLLNSTLIIWEGILFNYVILGSVNFFLFYLVAFFILPKVGFKQQRWVLLTVICFILALLFSYGKFRMERYRGAMLLKQSAMGKVAPPSYKKPTKPDLGPFSYNFRTYIQQYIYHTLSIIFIAFAYRLLIAWYLQEKLRRELEGQKLQAELSFLKLQVNPHFLFNALNNIYSLAVMENSRRTGNSILKLSDLMRYMLYEKEDAENKVSIDKEIRHINSYIDLEKMRHTDPIFINFSMEGDMTGKKIAPLLLFPLIENACKHGLLTDPEKPVNIDLNIQEHQIHFLIENWINTYVKDQTGGIGIDNVRKRLDLLYGKSYMLHIQQTAEKYIVNLHLPL